MAQDEPRRRGAGEITAVLVPSHGDVVSEPGGLLMRVGVTAEPRQQRDVVDDGAVGLVQPDIVRDPQPENARPHDVLHGLPETKVGGQREGRNQLGEPDL